MLINAYIRLNYIPNALKTADVIMITKPGKDLSEVESYRPISLPSIMSKPFQKLIPKHLKPIIEEKHLVSVHQFGFRKNNMTVVQVHRITDMIEKMFENKGVSSAVFLTLHRLSTEYGVDAYFINRGQFFPIICSSY
jgi:hypothetical protein